MPSLPPDVPWMAAALEAPVLALLLWILHGTRRDRRPPPVLTARPERAEAPQEGCAQHRAALERTRQDLAAFKLDVARTYVPLSLIRDVDGRLTAHLVRIEQKLDEATRSAHSTAAQLRVLIEDR